MDEIDKIKEELTNIGFVERREDDYYLRISAKMLYKVTFSHSDRSLVVGFSVSMNGESTDQPKFAMRLSRLESNTKSKLVSLFIQRIKENKDIKLHTRVSKVKALTKAAIRRMI